MKKIFLVGLIASLTGSVVGFAASTYFSDVSSGSWYEQSVINLSDKGILNGYPNGTFGPEKNVNRAELAVTINRLLQYIENGEVSVQEPVSNLCTDAPTATAIGRDIYPIAPEYSHLGFLGQLFTAADCGEQRVSQLFGVSGNDYTLGSTIWLTNSPSSALQDQLIDIGFTCATDDSSASCETWQLWDAVSTDSLLELEPYSDEFTSDDCTICG